MNSKSHWSIIGWSLFNLVALQFVFQVSYLTGVIVAPTATDTPKNEIQIELDKLVNP